jgi:hypothetical protein
MPVEVRGFQDFDWALVGKKAQNNLEAQNLFAFRLLPVVKHNIVFMCHIP